jgi:hypothetical protein
LLDEIGVGAEFGEHKGRSAGAAFGDQAGSVAAPHPIFVLTLEVRGEAPSVTPRHGGHVPSHGEHSAGVLEGKVELHQSLEAAKQRRVSPVAGPDPEGVRGGDRGESERLIIDTLVEVVGEVSQQEVGGRTQGGEPEPLGVQRAGIVPEGIDDRIRPRSDVHHNRGRWGKVFGLGHRGASFRGV